jgi:hypothetical protein
MGIERTLVPCETIEARLIAAVLKDDTGERWAESRTIPADAFNDWRCRNAWEHVAGAKSFQEACLGPARSFFADPTTGMEYERDRWRLLTSLLTNQGPSFLSEFSRLIFAGKSKTKARLEDRRFNLANPPAEPIPRFLINGKSVSTPGNLTNIIAQAKAGKTAWISAMIAARICADNNDNKKDTLGVSAGIAPGRLIHIDTEQSPFDHHRLILGSLRRTGVQECPSWLDSFALAGFSAQELRIALRLLMEGAPKEDGIFGVIVDGIADLVTDVNDSEESNQFIAELHGQAIEYGCPIINVIHENPGQENGKMRGHLGSQLERKAESNLRLKKVEEITVVFSERMRGAPILEKDGPRFAWSSEHGMHMSVATVGESRDDAKKSALTDLAMEIYDGKGSMRFADMTVAIKNVRDCSKRTAERRIAEMIKLKVITHQNFGSYAPTTANPPSKPPS